MGYLFFWQLMAHHSSMGFAPWIASSDLPTRKTCLQRENFGLYAELFNLSDEIKELQDCFRSNWPNRLQCPIHNLSDLGHTVKIEDTERKQRKLNRKIERNGMVIAKLTRPELSQPISTQDPC